MWDNIIQFLDELLSSVFARPAYDQPPHELPMNQPLEAPTIPIIAPQTAPGTPQTPTPSPTAQNPDVLLPWEDKTGSENNRHNVRALCDLEDLTFAQKNVLTACVRVESYFWPGAIHKNYIIKDGVRILASTDFGISQWNDFYHGSEITPDEALHNPEMSVRLMCKYWLAGRERQWVSFSSGAYLQFLGKV